MFANKWCNVKAFPGANQFIKHLSHHEVPMAFASNSRKESIGTKISFHRGWKESFSVVIGGNGERARKPLHKMQEIKASKAADMEVVSALSLSKQSHLCTETDEVTKPEKESLPPFQDWVEDTLPLKPWYIGGPVIKGFGRGSKMLGIPTANLSTEGHSTLLSEHPSGVYFGWAGLSNRGVFKMVMSIGWNPYFNNTEKTIEPWLLHEFDEDFYGEDLRLAIVGYIRAEANFPNIESLIARIHEDRKIAERALDLPLYSQYRDDQYLRNHT